VIDRAKSKAVKRRRQLRAAYNAKHRLARTPFGALLNGQLVFNPTLLPPGLRLNSEPDFSYSDPPPPPTSPARRAAKLRQLFGG
jgi:hypothetical protein